MSLFQNFAAEATADAKANQNKSRKPRQNPLTPGQTNSGQDAGLLGTPPDDAQQGQNMPGFATGQKGPAPAPSGTGGMLSGSVGGGLGGPLDKAAAATANQRAGGGGGGGFNATRAGGIEGAQTALGFTSAGAGAGSSATGQGSAANMQGDQGNRGATGPSQLSTNSLDTLSNDARTRQLGTQWLEQTNPEPGKGRDVPLDVGSVTDRTAGLVVNTRAGQDGGPEPGSSGIFDVPDDVQKAEEDRREQTEGMTPAQAALWDRLYGSDQMSDTEKANLEAKALADKNRNKEIIDRIAGGAGGSSAQQIMGTVGNEYGYGQALGDIEKEKYARQFAETQAAAGLAESAASRTERQANAFDEAQTYFGDKGYTVTAEGQLIGADGKPIDTKTLTGKDRETYERFMYEMGAENPQNRKEVAAQEQATQDAFGASTKASAAYNQAKSAYDKEKAKLDEMRKGQGVGSNPQLDIEISTQQDLVDKLAAGVAEAKKRADEAAKAYEDLKGA